MRHFPGLLSFALLAGACDQDRPDAPLVEDEDVTLAPPATAEDGFQYVMPPYDVPAGTEVQNCYFFESPYDEDICIGEITVAQNPGTHHMNVFRLGTEYDLWGEPGDAVLGNSDTTSPCWRSSNWADWPILVNSRQSYPDGFYDWTLPDGVAHKLKAHEVLMLQSHYVNANTQAGDHAVVYVNFDRVPCDDIQEVGTVFASNQGIDVCPGDVDVTFSASCGNDFPQDVTVIAANSHFHSRGTNFDIEAYDPVSGEYGDPFYENTSWDEPIMATDLDVVIPAGERLGWHCSYTYVDPVAPATCSDLGAGCCYVFGPSVEANEHCNMFAYYYPKVEDYSCI